MAIQILLGEREDEGLALPGNVHDNLPEGARNQFPFVAFRIRDYGESDCPSLHFEQPGRIRLRFALLEARRPAASKTLERARHSGGHLERAFLHFLEPNVRWSWRLC